MRASVGDPLGECRNLLRIWCTQWAVPRLADKLKIQISHRFRTSFGRCAPESSEIRIAAFLLDAPAHVLQEVVCHEAAHAAVHQLNHVRVRPHGPEWRALMCSAGFEPRVRLKPEDVSWQPARFRPPPKLWEHRCPVCQARRLAGRPVPQWRCAACLESGLDGRLVIAKVVGDGRRRE